MARAPSGGSRTISTACAGAPRRGRTGAPNSGGRGIQLVRRRSRNRRARGDDRRSGEVDDEDVDAQLLVVLLHRTTQRGAIVEQWERASEVLAEARSLPEERDGPAAEQHGGAEGDGEHGHEHAQEGEVEAQVQPARPRHLPQLSFASRYPAPRTVFTYRGWRGSGSIFCRRRLTCTSMERSNASSASSPLTSSRS